MSTPPSSLPRVPVPESGQEISGQVELLGVIGPSTEPYCEREVLVQCRESGLIYKALYALVDMDRNRMAWIYQLEEDEFSRAIQLAEAGKVETDPEWMARRARALWGKEAARPFWQACVDRNIRTHLAAHELAKLVPQEEREEEEIRQLERAYRHQLEPQNPRSVYDDMLMRRWRQAGHWDKIIDLVEREPEPDNAHWELWLTAMLVVQAFGEAVERVERICDLNFSPRTYRAYSLDLVHFLPLMLPLAGEEDPVSHLHLLATSGRYRPSIWLSLALGQSLAGQDFSGSTRQAREAVQKRDDLKSYWHMCGKSWPRAFLQHASRQLPRDWLLFAGEKGSGHLVRVWAGYSGLPEADCQAKLGELASLHLYSKEHPDIVPLLR